MNPIRAHARILVASLVGTAVEFYDFQIYGLAAAQFFGPLFFPVHSPGAQTLLSLMSFSIAFIARPVGAIAFGHFGDRVGRKSTLVASLLLMGGCTLAIAFLPTYAMVGWVGPALLCLLRFGQGFGLGGEWAGAALLSVEYAPEGWKARFGAAPAVGATTGFFTATVVFLLLARNLSPGQMLEWGWRLPFLASALLVIFGLWVRLKIAETPEFRAALEHEPPSRVPIAQIFAHHAVPALAGAAGVVCLYAIVYLNTTFALAHATGKLGFERETILFIMMVGTAVSAISTVLAAILSDRWTTPATLAIGALAAAFLGLAFGFGLNSGSLPWMAATFWTFAFIIGFCQAPLGGWLTGLFPVDVRYSGVAFAYNAGGIVGGAVTPLIAQTMTASGMGNYVGVLLSAAGLMTYAGVRLARPAQAKQGSLTPVAALIGLE